MFKNIKQFQYGLMEVLERWHHNLQTNFPTNGIPSKIPMGGVWVLILRKKLWEGLTKKGNLAITSFAKKENNLCKAKINARGQRSNILSKDESTSSWI